MTAPRRAKTTRIVIDVDADDPIEGTLREPLQHAGPFRGWLAFTALIDAAVRPGDHPLPNDPGFRLGDGAGATIDSPGGTT